MANSDNEQEVKLLMNQWKKPVLIPKEEQMKTLLPVVLGIF